MGKCALSFSISIVSFIIVFSSACDNAPGSSPGNAGNPDATLSSLALSTGTLSPAFDPGITNYTVYLANDITSLTATPTATGSDYGKIKVTIDGVNWHEVVSGNASVSLDLLVGANTVQVQVTAKDPKFVMTYQVTVHRSPRTDANLSALGLGAVALGPSFNSTVVSYTAEVADTVTTVSVTPTAADAMYDRIEVRVNSGSWVAVDSGLTAGPFDLNTGANAVLVRVTAQDGSTTQVYTVIVSRMANDNADLSGLAVSGATLDTPFDPSTVSYHSQVYVGTTSVTVTATASDPGYNKIEVQSNNGTWQQLVSGQASGDLTLDMHVNIINLRVTAHDGATTKTYVMAIDRVWNTNADLTSLMISAGSLDPVFSNITTAYNVAVSSEKTGMTVTPTADDPYYHDIQVQVNGGAWTPVVSGNATAPFKVVGGNNTVKIQVTAHDAVTIKTYTITVYRTPGANADLSSLILGGGTLAPAFSPTKLTYYAQVPNGSADITVTPAAADLNYNKIECRINNGAWTNVVSGSASGNLALNVGVNEVVVRVTAENGTSMKAYGVAVFRAESGMADWTFQPVNSIDGTVYVLKELPDGKIVAGGNFTAVGGVPRKHIMRLNADGTPDLSFYPGMGADGGVNTLVLQPDGKIVIGGIFTSYNGTGRNRIARLNSDGSLDTTFNPGTGANNSVRTIALQSDGKIVIGGHFTSYDGTGRNMIARLNSDGTLDTDFNPGTGANNYVLTLALQSDGKVVVGGDFTSYNGTGRNMIARLNGDGTLDTAFTPGTGVEGTTVKILTLQSNGKILVGGDFTGYNGTGRKNITRLNGDGTLDTAFTPGTGANYDIRTLALQSDGKVVAGGGFTNYNGAERNGIARLNNDGTVDATFHFQMDAVTIAQTLALQSDGKILVGNCINSMAGMSRLNSDGTPDTTFDPGTEADGRVATLALQPDGKIVIGGDFTSYNMTGRNRIARLNGDGTLDTTFNPGTGANNHVYALALQPDGKVVIGGSFTGYNGTTINRIARLNGNGTLDVTFNPGTGIEDISGSVNTLALQPDGKIVIGGDFTGYNGTGRNNIARLNGNGTLDTTFNPGSGSNASVTSLALQPDGKIIIGGYFSSYNSTNKRAIARLNNDGSLDATFITGTGFTTFTFGLTMSLQADEKIVVGGDFGSYNGTPASGLARLNSDGTIDTTLDPGTGPSGTIYTLTALSGGKILIGGEFTAYDGSMLTRLARLDGDGALDITFNSGLSANYAINASAEQPDGKILIGGDFTNYNGTARNHIVRIFP